MPSSSEDEASDDEEDPATVLGAFSAIHPPLPSKTQTKIWNSEFIDLCSLVQKDHCLETTTVRKTSTSTITSVQKSAPKPLNSLHQWNQAFQLYADCYTTKYPNQAPQLFRYMSIIQSLAQSNYNWQMYDEKFRHFKASSPTTHWGQLHTETYLFCMMKNSTFRPFTTVSKPSSRTPSHIMQRKGYCWEYQRTASCSKPRCSLKHQCANCEGQSHSASRCNKPLRPFNPSKPTASHTTTHLPSQKD